MVAAGTKSWRPSVLDVLLLVVVAWAYAKAKVRWLTSTAHAPYLEAATEVVAAAGNESALESVTVAEYPIRVNRSQHDAAAAARLLSAGQGDENELLAVLEHEMQQRRERMNAQLAENHKVQKELIQRQRAYLERERQREAAAAVAAAKEKDNHFTAKNALMARIVYSFRSTEQDATVGSRKLAAVRKSSPQLVSVSEAGPTSTGSQGLVFEAGASALLETSSSSAGADAWEVDSVDVTLLRSGSDEGPTKTLGRWRGSAATPAGGGTTSEKLKAGLRRYYFRQTTGQKELADYHSATVTLFGGVTSKEPAALSLWKKL